MRRVGVVELKRGCSTGRGEAGAWSLDRGEPCDSMHDAGGAERDNRMHLGACQYGGRKDYPKGQQHGGTGHPRCRMKHQPFP